MDRMSLKKFLEQYIDGTPIYPSDFPMNVADCYMFDFSGNTALEENLSETHLIVFRRSPNIEEAEQASLDLMKRLNKLTNINIGESHVLLIKTVGKHAEYKGRDEDGRFYFTSQYRLLLDDIIE